MLKLGFAIRIAGKTALIFAALALATCAWAEPTDFGPAQRDRMKALAAEMRGKMERARYELLRARMDLFQAYSVYDLDERKVRAALDRIGRAQLALLNLHLDNQIELRRILNESQFSEFRRRMERFGRHMAGVFGPHSDGPMGRLPDMDRPPDRELLERIGVGADQAKRIWREADSTAAKAIVDRLVRESKRLIDLYTRYDLDVDAARKLIDSIHRSQMDLAELNHKNQQTLRAVLTEQQFERLQQEISKRFRPGQHRRRAGRF
ncbi:MAG: Spy/CpxP family protein refolding chaperone [Armatimonadota bacterium]